MAELANADVTDLSPQQLEALAMWINEPNYAEVARRLDISRSTARRWVLAAVNIRVNEILPSADEYFTLAIEIIEKRLAQLDKLINREAYIDDDNVILIGDQLSAMQVERGYIADMVKLLGLAAPDKLLVAVVPARPLTEGERAERIVKWQTHQPLLEDHDGPDRHDPTGSDNGRPVDPTPGQ